ncbi:hypothetical protein GCM10022290_10300 [Sagittula marina]
MVSSCTKPSSRITPIASDPDGAPDNPCAESQSRRASAFDMRKTVTRPPTFRQAMLERRSAGLQARRWTFRAGKPSFAASRHGACV